MAEIHWNIHGFGRNRPRTDRKKLIIAELRIRDGDFCWVCDNAIDFDLPRDHDEAATIDHRIPLSEGGSNFISNLSLAHRCCNVRRESIRDIGRTK